MEVQNHESEVQSCSHRPIQGPRHPQNLPSADYLGPRALGRRKSPLVRLPASLTYYTGPYMAHLNALDVATKGTLLNLSCLWSLHIWLPWKPWASQLRAYSCISVVC